MSANERCPTGAPSEAPATKLGPILTFDVDLTADQARRLTERIRLTAHTFAESRTKLIELVNEAKDGNAHLALGYASWTAYLSDVLGDEPLRLARDDRREMVAVLSAEGMSTRAIAPIVGADNATVHRDLEGVANATPGDDHALPFGYGNPFECGNHCVHEPICQRVKKTPQKITGLDGRSYPAPSKPVVDPGKPRQRPLPDEYRTAVLDLDKVIRRLEKLHADARFTKHRENLLSLHGGLSAEHARKLADINEQLGGGAR